MGGTCCRGASLQQQAGDGPPHVALAALTAAGGLGQPHRYLLLLHQVALPAFWGLQHLNSEAPPA